MRPLFHPRAASLAAWLEAPEPKRRIDDHVARCERCADRLVSLSDPAPDLAEALSAHLAPVPGLTARIEGSIASAVGTRSLLAWALDLYGAGVETVRLLVEEEDG
jgi:hypothetical protein